MGATMIGMGVGAAASGTDAGATRMTGGLLPVLGDGGHGEWLCLCCAGIFFPCEPHDANKASQGSSVHDSILGIPGKLLTKQDNL
jgi:hypothetical protein